MILYISQLCAADDPRRVRAWQDADPQTYPPLPNEKDFLPKVFSELGVVVHIVDATQDPLPAPHPYRGVIVGGSLGSANDREAWRVALENWLRQYPDIPLLGICGGHQLLARALGGQVGIMPEAQLGVFPLDLDLPGFRGQVVQLHRETVQEPPLGAKVWASDAWGIQALQYGPSRWTFQFHPEITPQLLNEAAQRCGFVPADATDAIADGRHILAAWLQSLP